MNTSITFFSFHDRIYIIPKKGKNKSRNLADLKRKFRRNKLTRGKAVKAQGAPQTSLNPGQIGCQFGKNKSIKINKAAAFQKLALKGNLIK